jgi:N12 class adenine-specific DNA methylase
VALETLDDLRRDDGAATPAQQEVLARWSGWGAIPQIFDETRSDFAEARARARRLLGTEDAWEAARRTILNAHYTSAAVINATWGMLESLGFRGGPVLEPGCGSGNFIGFAPAGADITGIELDPTTAEVARHLYGTRATIRDGRFEDFGPPDGSFDAAIGNVPFAKLTPHDPRHNRHRLALHNYCIVKSLHLVAPGGTVALLTSRYTLDARSPTARRAIDELADLVGAIRLPAGAFAASSGTDVVVDLLVLRRREARRPSLDRSWLDVVPIDARDGAPIHVNSWFDAHPEFVLGELRIDRGMYRNHELTVAADGNLCLDESGMVELNRIAQLLGSTLEDAATQVRSLVWEDPTTGRLEPAASYLSGNVRRKLEEARRAADEDPKFRDHVDALDQVLPPQLEPGEIAVRLGVPWIPPADVESFCLDVLGARIEIEYLASLGRWEVAAPAGRRGVAFSAEWGTPRADAVTLLRASLNQQLHTVYDETDDGRRVRNDPETIAAREKQEALGQRFATWLWDDDARARRLAGRYNELFRSTVVPTHDGSHLTLPGLASSFTPHPHQRDAVARILTDGRALLAHAVGAGKTATMAIAAMEMRRLGLAQKPALVVPNHMLEQFAREWLQLYPTARLLIADRDNLSKKRRTEFAARATTGDWDAIIFSHSSFVRLPLGPDQQVEYVGERLRQLREAVSQSHEGKSLSVKRLERYVAAEEERLRALQASHRKDDGVRFEETGIDHLMVDEAHLFKNRRVASSIEGMAHRGSQRAEDLDAKLWLLRKRHGPRVVTFATATPVANSMAELWVMQSYLQPDVLEQVGLAPFDAWAANFGRTVTSLELSPDGASWRLSTRFARFCNVPELMGLWRQVADVRTADDLALPVPSIAGGEPETVVVPGSDALTDYVALLAERADRVRSRAVDPTEDNMLKITGDGRRAALDLRLVGEPPCDRGGKLAMAASRIASIWEESRTRSYGSGSQGVDRPGSLQLVFCDTSTPAGTEWNAYDELRRLLVDRGLARDQVRFVHEASTDETKARLFAECRDGRVAVLVGSTEKMGVGTNVQDRAIALHHIDCPWRPADIEQREGRIIRQGNLNPEAAVIRYVTEGSFDTYMWQTLERKAAFIGQVTGGGLHAREVDDIADTALTYAEVKALATGNPLIMEKAGIDAEVARLTRLERAHGDEQHRLRRAVESSQRQEAGLRHKATRIEKAIARRVDTRADSFRMTIGDRAFEQRSDAGVELSEIGKHLLDAVPHNRSRSDHVGTLGGLELEIEATRIIAPEVIVRLGAGVIEARWSGPDWAGAEPARVVMALERQLNRLDDDLLTTRDTIDRVASERARAQSRVGQPFEHAEELAQARTRQLEIAELLAPASAAEPIARPAVSPEPLHR